MGEGKNIQTIIDEFYEKHVKHLEELMSDVLYGYRWKFLGAIASYVVLCIILGIAVVLAQETPIAFYVNIVLLVGFAIATVFFLYKTYKIYYYVSNKIPLKKKIVRNLHLRENGSIDKVYWPAAACFYFLTFIAAVIMIVLSLSDFFLLAVLISFVSGICFLIYWFTLTHRTKIKRDFFVVKKPFTRRKVKLKWTDIQDARIDTVYHHDTDGGQSYTVFNLYLKTTISEDPIKIYIGRNRTRPIVQIIPAFIRYMRERQGGSPAMGLVLSPAPISAGEVNCPSCGMRIEGPINICPFCGESL